MATFRKCMMNTRPIRLDLCAITKGRGSKPTYLQSIRENLFLKGRYAIELGEGGGIGGDVVCSIADQPTIDFIINKNKGDMLNVRGKIYDHSFGSIDLKDCEITD